MVHPQKMLDMMELAKYRHTLFKHPELRNLFFEMTDCCNLNCAHCGSNCSKGNRNYLSIDVMRKVMKSIADRYDTGNIMICLTGGEPMLHPGIYDVIREAKVLGFAVGMTTNGTLIDEMSASRLLWSGLDTMAVSLDGIGDVHDSFRGMKGSFNRTLNGIREMKHIGFEPEVLTVVHKGNITQLDAIYQMLTDMGVYSWRIVNVDPIGRAAGNLKLLLDAAEMKSLLSFIRDKRYSTKNDILVNYGCSHFLTYEYENEVRDYYFQCGAGTLVASVMANGDIGACLDIERRNDLIQGNAYVDDFIYVWEHHFGIFRTDLTEKSSKCRECGFGSVCMGDSAHTWNYDLNEPTYCVAAMLMKG